MNISNGPEMSVVLITPDTYGTIRRTVECLKAQTVKDKLELVIVALSASGPGISPEESGFFTGFRS